MNFLFSKKELISKEHLRLSFEAARIFVSTCVIGEIIFNKYGIFVRVSRMKLSMDKKREPVIFDGFRINRDSFRPDCPGIGGKIIEVNGTSETKRQTKIEDPAEMKPVEREGEEEQEKNEREKEDKDARNKTVRKCPGKTGGNWRVRV